MRRSGRLWQRRRLLLPADRHSDFGGGGRRRAAACGGDIDVDRGTRVEVIVPRSQKIDHDHGVRRPSSVTFHPCTVASFCTRQNKDRRCRSCCRPPHEDLSRCFHVELIGGKMTWMYPWKIVLAGRRLARSYVGNTGQHWATRGTTGQHARVGGRRHLRLLLLMGGVFLAFILLP